MSPFVQQLPNYITYLRLALIPVFVVLMIEPTETMVSLALLVFVFASLTDYIDGYLARRFGAVSDFGKLLDPIADKILVMAALVMLVAQRSMMYGESWVPGWMVVLVLARETWVNGLRSVAAAQGVVVAASKTGKIKSALQMAAIVLLLLHDVTISVGGTPFPCQYLGLRLLLISIVISYWGAAEYTWLVLNDRGKGEVEESPAASTTVAPVEQAAAQNAGGQGERKAG